MDELVNTLKDILPKLKQHECDQILKHLKIKYHINKRALEDKYPSEKEYLTEATKDLLSLLAMPMENLTPLLSQCLYGIYGQSKMFPKHREIKTILIKHRLEHGI
jgi:hypothetical protein